MRRRALAVAPLALALAVFAAGAAWGDPSEEAPGTASASSDYTLGKKAVEARDWATAIQLLSRAEVQDDRNADLENLLGYAYRNAGRLEDAFRHYRAALRLNPRHRGAHEYIGEAYLMVNNVAKAKEHLGTLDKLCFFPCSEFTDLKRSISDYEGKRR